MKETEKKIALIVFIVTLICLAAVGAVAYRIVAGG